MLILTRKKEEAIIIGNEIVIKVLDCNSSQARLGIEAPRNVSVHREEIYQLLNEKNEKEEAP